MNYIFKNTKVSAGNLLIPKGTCAIDSKGVQTCTPGRVTSPPVTVTVTHDDETFGEFVSRGYDGYAKSSICLHVVNGYVDLMFQYPGQGGFVIRQVLYLKERKERERDTIFKPLINIFLSFLNLSNSHLMYQILQLWVIMIVGKS